MIRHMTPLGAAARGLLAGIAGTMAIGALMKATAKMMPDQKPIATPDEKQKSEMPPETVARRLVDDFMRRGPIEGEAKERATRAVQVGFGAAWGALYGLHSGTHRVFHGPLGGALFGTIVWGIANGVILPRFRLSAPIPQQSLAHNAYNWGLHVVYGEVVAASFASLRARTWLPIAAPILARWTVRNVPRLMRPAAYRVVEAVKEARPAHRARDLVEAFSPTV